MAVTVTHATVTAVPDDPAYDIGSDEWNAAHSVSGLGTAAESAATDFVAVVGDTMTGTLTSTLGTLTANTPALDISQTWNNGAISFAAVKITVTNTAFDYPASSIFEVNTNSGVRAFHINGYGGVEANYYYRVGGPSGAYIDDGGTGTARMNNHWVIGRNTSNLGFYDATPIAKPTVTGAKGGNAALASLLTELANLGLITDGTT